MLRQQTYVYMAVRREFAVWACILFAACRRVRQVSTCGSGFGCAWTDSGRIGLGN